MKDPRAHLKSDVDLPQPKVLRILCAEDVPEDAELYLRVLQDAGYEVAADVVSTREEFVRKLESAPTMLFFQTIGCLAGAERMLWRI